MGFCRKFKPAILFLYAFITALSSIYSDVDGKIKDKYSGRETPPVYKDFSNYPDIKGLNRVQKIAKFTISWETIGPIGDSGTVLGLSWDRSTKEFPMLTKNLTNIEQAKKIYDQIHALNPCTMIGVEYKWDAIKDYELPADHKWWKRDIEGNRILYSQPSTPPRYEMNVDDPEYIKWSGERCKAILDTGVVDFIMFDHIRYMQLHGGDPAPFLKRIREILGPDAVIIGNTHFEKMQEISNYIDAWGEATKESADYLNAMLFWENNGRKPPKFNCWEFYGEKDDLKAMRYYTTLVMTRTNASLRYINHTGPTKPSPWYDFWDVKIGKVIGEGTIAKGFFSREYSNGTTVCNNTFISKKIIFKEIRKRASTGEQGTVFKIPGRDGDMFLYVK